MKLVASEVLREEITPTPALRALLSKGSGIPAVELAIRAIGSVTSALISPPFVFSLLTFASVTVLTPVTKYTV